jgi:hypothetical protein
MAMTYLVQAVSAEASAIRLALRLYGHRGRASHDAYPMAIVTAHALAQPVAAANGSHSLTVSSTVAAACPVGGRPSPSSKRDWRLQRAGLAIVRVFDDSRPRDSSIDTCRDAIAGLVIMVRKPVSGLSDAR